MIARLLSRWIDQDLYLDARRINLEVVAERRAELWGDVAYRDKVKLRMMEGLTSEQLAPLIHDGQIQRRG